MKEYTIQIKDNVIFLRDSESPEVTKVFHTKNANEIELAPGLKYTKNKK